MMNRRTLLSRASVSALALGLAPVSGAEDNAFLKPFTLIAGKSESQLLPKPQTATRVWSYNQQSPGPEIRVRQGDTVRIKVRNNLTEETTVHWHGLRVPNAMDGVPHLTQTPIPVGGQFVYEFAVPDAGTYWYHPHQRSFEQLARGLYGAFIVEEREPLPVDRDITWILDDWRLDQDAQISTDFTNRHDATHGGRMGNHITVNGIAPSAFNVQHGERVRLRLINAANARIFRLRFDHHEPWVIALDGQPLEPHLLDNNTVELGPAMRVDLVLDMTGDPGRRYQIYDSSFGYEIDLLEIEYNSAPLRMHLPKAAIALPPNSLPELDWSHIERYKIRFSDITSDDRITSESGITAEQMIEAGKIWSLNGVVGNHRDMQPFVTLKGGQSYLFEMDNDTAWQHPIHFHGHVFLVVSRDGDKPRYTEWRDTLLMAPFERAEIAFVADNLGDWLFHCHTQEHHTAGMVGVVRVSSY